LAGEFIGPGGSRFAIFDPRAPVVHDPKLVNGYQKQAPAAVELISGATLDPEEVRWLWPAWLALAKVHLLAGSPGTGKTTIALWFAAMITTGSHWPDGGDAPLGDVLMWSGEDGLADTLLPRFLAAGGDPKRLHFVGGMRDHDKPRPFDPAADMPHLAQAARRLPELKLLILDPVVAAVAGDSHKNTETRRGLQPVVDLATKLGCAVLGITHLSKGTSGREPLERVAGSLAFGAVARVVLATVKAADPDAPRRLVRVKSNLGPDRGGIEYTLFGAPVPGCDFGAQRVEWGQVLDGSARELMAIEIPDNEAGATEDAETFLRDILADGPVATRDIKSAAAAHGHKWRTVERAKAVIGITASKATGSPTTGWSWQLPAETNTANFDHQDRHHD
jgi:hypothetical protein